MNINCFSEICIEYKKSRQKFKTHSFFMLMQKKKKIFVTFHIVSREHTVKLTETYNTNKNLVKELHH